MTTLKLGKLPARPESVQLKLIDYLDVTTVLPKIPPHFGHESLVSNYGMLGNDRYGDCVFAGAAHETMLWNAETGHQVAFTDRAVLSDYSAVTGFNVADPASDQGTDVQQAAAYRQKTGVLDARGVRHKIAAYVALTPGSLAELYAAAYIFGAVGVGIEFPASAMDQFNRGQAWSPVRGSVIEGGHYIPVVARHLGIEVITWGHLQMMTPQFYMQYCDEAVVYLSTEILTGTGRTPEGFNLTQLQSDLKAVAQQ